MKNTFYFIYLLLIIGFWSCNRDKNNDSIKKESKELVSEDIIKKDPSVIQVQFAPDIILSWNTKNRLEEDTSYHTIKNDRQKIYKLIESISDEEDLNVPTCVKEETLKKGDVAFLYLIRIYNVPPAKCFKMQFCLPDQMCESLLGYLKRNRKEAQQKLKIYLQTEEFGEKH